MFTQYSELRAEFATAVEKLPNFKRAAAWEFVKALEARCDALHSDRLTQAAPEMLEALRLADAYLGWGDASLENVHATVRAAIAKAEAAP